MIEAAAAMLDAASRAVDELEALARSDSATDDDRRRLGLAIGHLETAGCLLDEAEQDTVGWVLGHEALELAHTTVLELVVPSAGERALAIVIEMARLRAASDAGEGDEMRRRLARERLAASPT